MIHIQLFHHCHFSSSSMSSSVFNKSHVVVSKCFEFFVQLLYQQSHSQIENSGKYFFNLDLKGTSEFILIKYLINILTTCLRGGPPERMSTFVTCPPFSCCISILIQILPFSCRLHQNVLHQIRSDRVASDHKGMCSYSLFCNTMTI